MSIKSSEYRNRFNAPRKAISKDGIKYKILGQKIKKNFKVEIPSAIVFKCFCESTRPSLYKTIGISVIFSELEGVKDVYGDAVYYIKQPLEANNIANGIKKVIEDKELRKKLIENGNAKLKEVEEKNEYKKIFEIINKYRKIQKTWKFNN